MVVITSPQRYADVYTSGVENFLNYSGNHTFYAARQYWPHETLYSGASEEGAP